jgi:hypothetical protein
MLAELPFLARPAKIGEFRVVVASPVEALPASQRQKMQPIEAGTQVTPGRRFRSSVIDKRK